MRSSELRILAQPEFHEVLRSGMLKTRRRFTLEKLPAPRGVKKDPFNLRKIIDDRPLLLVVPRNRGPANVVAGPLLGTTPVGILQADHARQLEPWLRAMEGSHTKATEDFKPDWAVLAMGKNIYLRLGEQILSGLRGSTGDVDVKHWLADQYDREKLCRELAKGPRVVLYLGHGRTSGWAGYQTIRWKHLDKRIDNPSGVVIAFACRTLSRQRNAVPFGSKWIFSGYAKSYVGSVIDLPIDCSMELARILAFRMPGAESIGDLLQKVRSDVGDNTPEGQSLTSFRIIGDPECPLR